MRSYTISDTHSWTFPNTPTAGTYPATHTRRCSNTPPSGTPRMHSCTPAPHLPAAPSGTSGSDPPRIRSTRTPPTRRSLPRSSAGCTRPPSSRRRNPDPLTTLSWIQLRWPAVLLRRHCIPFGSSRSRPWRSCPARWWGRMSSRFDPRTGQTSRVELGRTGWRLAGAGNRLCLDRSCPSLVVFRAILCSHICLPVKLLILRKYQKKKESILRRLCKCYTLWNIYIYRQNLELGVIYMYLGPWKGIWGCRKHKI